MNLKLEILNTVCRLVFQTKLKYQAIFINVGSGTNGDQNQMMISQEIPLRNLQIEKIEYEVRSFSSALV